MATVVGAIGTDPRCSVHQCVLGIREGKEGWFHVVCPSSAACPDDGSLWANIVSTFLFVCLFKSTLLLLLVSILLSPDPFDALLSPPRPPLLVPFQFVSLEALE